MLMLGGVASLACFSRFFQGTIRFNALRAESVSFILNVATTFLPFVNKLIGYRKRLLMRMVVVLVPD